MPPAKHILPPAFARAAVALCIAAACVAWRDPFARKVNQGNALYADGKYDEALSRYADAQSNAPKSPLVLFNMGAAHFREGKFDDAAKLFQQVTASNEADLILRAKANYNIGNCLVRKGNYKEALFRYQTALDLTQDKEGQPIPGSARVRADAKFNAEWVQRKILEVMNKDLRNRMPDYLAISPARPTAVVGQELPIKAAGYAFGKNRKRDGVKDDGSPKADDIGPIPIEPAWATDVPEAVGKIDAQSGIFKAGGQVGAGKVVVEDRTQGRWPLRASAELRVVMPDRLVVGPATVTVSAGSSAVLAASAYWNGPDGIPDDKAKAIAQKQPKAGKAPAFKGDDVGPLPIAVEWFIKSGKDLGVMDAQTGKFIAGPKAGKVVVAARPVHASCRGMEATAEVFIVKPDYLRIWPAQAAVGLGDERVFSARAYAKGPNGKIDGVDPMGKPRGDDYGPLDVEVAWSVDAPADVGTIDAGSGLFTAGKTKGKATVRARCKAPGVKLDDATATVVVTSLDYIRVFPPKAKMGLKDNKQFVAHGYSMGANDKIDGVDEKGKPKGDDIGPLPAVVKWSTDLKPNVAVINTQTGLLRSLDTPGQGSVFAATQGSGTIREASAKVQIQDKKKKQKQKQKKKKQKQKQKQQKQRLSKKDAMRLLKMLEEEQRKRKRKRRAAFQGDYVDKAW